ncbi:hypothetical protein AC1031_010584 [Aphanomyces cochlioides]|nr:hypothetical protein AC1031_010584 [Aphanomyces cochlioides]
MSGEKESASARETIRAAFKTFDADDSGRVDASELAELVSSLGGIFTEGDLQSAMRILDKDGDGYIDYDEFERWWMNQSDDLDGDGNVGELEKSLHRIKKLGEQRFHVDIHTASWHGDIEVVNRLLQTNSEVVNERDTTEYGDMNTPLHYAAYQGHTNLCLLLMQAKAKVDATNAFGCTPLFFAAQQDRIEIVQLLLQKGGANAKLRESEHHFSPVDVASSNAMLDVFRSHPGDKPSIPAPPKASNISQKSIHLTWTQPSPKVTETLPISGYKLKITREGGNNISTLKLVGPYPPAFTMDKLRPDTTYSIQIAAVSLHGASDYSTALVVSTEQGTS